ncbi:outer membrane beta-barrel protein [Methylocystis sp. WRRC1]|uniref:outer membrane protein n=1 Tax=Methylocystis sp. WRRC1 TaxID=1732014 RepID=UPI001D14710F|nr:outer membrane beta-barrel protein [Methylocystis sp. WRRC1]MCC3245936.1 outer membrane beta-barrel protein [Methylocystis sp. WRRC1]
MFSGKSITSRFAACALTFAGFCAPASGADLPSFKEAPVAPPPVFTWTGLYVGFNFGHTWTASDPVSIGSLNLFDLSGAGFGPASALGATGVVDARLGGYFFGGQAGYNWQFSEKLIAGFEADIQGAGVRGGGHLASILPAPAGFAVSGVKLSRGLEYFGTVRGRFGYAVTPTFMAYVTGGLAYGGVTADSAIRQSLTPSLLLAEPGKLDYFDNRVGWTVGAGGEVALSRNLSAKLEYLYYDLGGVTLSTPSYFPLTFSDVQTKALTLADASRYTTRYNGHILRAGLNYRFDWSIPETPGSSATPLFASPQFAMAEKPAPADWSLRVIPYLWALNTNGSLKLRDESLAANTTIIDAIAKSSSFPLPFMGRVELSNGPWSAYGDFVWTQMRFSGSTLTLRSPVADIALALNSGGHLRQTFAVGEAGVGYELARFSLMSAPQSVTSFDAYAGARYVYLGLDLTLDALGAVNSSALGAQALIARNIESKARMEWVDPLVGLRMRHSFAPGDAFELRGDVGGFGAGSNFSWQAYGGYTHDFEFEGVKLAGLIGYRALSLDYSKWVKGRENGVNAIFHGPVVGVGARF